MKRKALLVFLVSLLFVSALNLLVAAEHRRSDISDGIRMTADAIGKYQYADDFRTPKVLADAFPDNLAAEHWEKGQITSSGPHVRALTYRFYADRLIEQFDVQVGQSANAQLGGVNVLYLSFNGLDWVQAAD